MPKVKVYNLSGNGVGEIELSDSVFDATVNENVLYDVLKAQLASKRKGAASAQTRAEVTATSRKLYKQKGTGNARHGSRRAPIFVGGGTVLAVTGLGVLVSGLRGRTQGGLGATALVLAGLGPVIWLVADVASGRVGTVAALRAAARIALLSLAVSPPLPSTITASLPAVSTRSALAPTTAW